MASDHGLKTLIHESRASIDAIATRLDGLSHAQRVEALATLGRADQRALYRLAADAPAITREHFVPARVPPRTAVIHHGKNTLPIPGFTRFAKAFARPDDGSARLFGYNQGRSEPIIGPGYFVAVDTAGNAAWEARGAVVVDYFQVPDGPVPDGWPRVKRNDQGLQVLVYHRTRDFMRKVSAQVSIGAAFKVEKALDHYFTLCRED